MIFILVLIMIIVIEGVLIKELLLDLKNARIDISRYQMTFEETGQSMESEEADWLEEEFDMDP